MNVGNRASALAIVAMLALTACEKKPEAPATPKGPQADVYARAGSAGAEWLTYGGTYDEQRHSSLTRVNAANVGDLGVAWT